MIEMIPAVRLRLKLHREERQSAEEQRSLTAKLAKAAMENKSLTAKNTIVRTRANPEGRKGTAPKVAYRKALPHIYSPESRAVQAAALELLAIEPGTAITTPVLIRHNYGASYADFGAVSSRPFRVWFLLLISWRPWRPWR